MADKIYEYYDDNGNKLQISEAELMSSSDKQMHSDSNASINETDEFVIDEDPISDTDDAFPDEDFFLSYPDEDTRTEIVFNEEEIERHDALVEIEAGEMYQTYLSQPYFEEGNFCYAGGYSQMMEAALYASPDDLETIHREKNIRFKPSSLDEFKAELALFSAQDYSADKPYKCLINSSDGKIGRFDQFLSCMREDATKKRADMTLFEEKASIAKSDAHLSSYFMDSISTYVISCIIGEMSKVLVFPLMCGSGKSTAITEIIACFFPHVDNLAWEVHTPLINMRLANDFLKLTGKEPMYAEASDESWNKVSQNIREQELRSYHLHVDKVKDWETYLKELPDTINFQLEIEKQMRENPPDSMQGLLIVTDNVDRMREYWDPLRVASNPHLSAELKEFVASHQNDVIALDSKNKKNVRKEDIHNARVLIITTQRFFEYAKMDTIEEYLHGGRYQRNLIIFDEEPYLSKTEDITPITLNHISDALYLALDDSMSNQDDRDWCLSQWEAARARLMQVFRKLERDGLPAQYYKDSKESLTDDDDRFFKCIEERRNFFYGDRGISDALPSLYDLRTLCTDFGLFSYRSRKGQSDIAIGKNEVYETKFTVYHDNRSKLLDVGAKCIIFDGTGDISPRYQEDYIEIKFGKNYDRDLSRLTVKLVDMPTRTQDLADNGKKIFEAVSEYLISKGCDPNQTVLFTKKMAESYIPQSKATANLAYYSVEHFGNIKGTNKYNDKTSFVQVGIDRHPEAEYCVRYIAHHKETKEKLEQCVGDKDKMKEAMDLLEKDTHHFAVLMWNSILADIDQNLFRGVIRNHDNDLPMDYYIFMDLKMNQPLVALIHKRYEALNAKVEEDTDPFSGETKRMPKTRIEKLQYWYNSWDGALIKKTEILKALGFDGNTFVKLLKASPSLKDKFDKAREYASQLGYKKGYYQKPEYVPNDSDDQTK